MTQASVTADAIIDLAAHHKSVEEFAIAVLKLVSERISELAKRPSVDMVELQAVADELNASIAQLSAKIKPIKLAM